MEISNTEVLLYELGHAIRILRQNKEYLCIKCIYESLDKNGIIKLDTFGGSEAERYLKMWLIYSFTATKANSEDEEVKTFAENILNKVRSRNPQHIDINTEQSTSFFEEGTI